MQLLNNVKPLDDYRLACTFDNGVEKIADVSQYLNAEAFRPLRNPEIFTKIQNKQYYVEWLNGEVDLSADTLWHIGVVMQNA